MKKILLGISCCLLVASGLWVTKAVELFGTDEVLDTTTTSLTADLSVRDMALQSELIITGECVETRSVWLDRTLVTLATISVSEVIKGEEASSVTVVLPGGVDANRRIPVAMTYAGAPQVAPEEKVFLFLTSEEGVTNGYTVMGFAQGKFSIVENEQGEQLVSRDLTKVKLQSGPGVVRGNSQFAPLSNFKEKVKGYLRQQ